MTPTEPTVSVLMPVYNAERYVAEAVESILHQTFQDFEFIIVDDGATDGSLKILRYYEEKDSRIRLVSRPNTGIVTALNEMLSLARGSLIARMDADDVSAPERFEEQVAYLREHDDCCCVGSWYAIVDATGRLLTRRMLAMEHEGIDRNHLCGQASIAHPSVMMRAEAVRNAGGYDTAFFPAEDLDLWLRLAEAGRLANVGKFLLRYRIHPQAVSTRQAVVQDKQRAKACERAWERRGIRDAAVVPSENIRPTGDRAAHHRFAIQCGWWAFNSGERKTAILYGAKGVAMEPTNSAGWRLLACSLMKRMPRGA